MPGQKAKMRSTFAEYCRKITSTYEQFLTRHNWIDAETGGPDLQKLEPLVNDQQASIPIDLLTVLSSSSSVGAAHETAGNLAVALSWYRVGQYLWRGAIHIEDQLEVGVPEMQYRLGVSGNQLSSAVCADRVGNRDRARPLYELAAFNWTLTPEEIKGFTSTNQRHVIWSRLPYRAYALACYEQWSEALEVARLAQHVLEQDGKARVTENYQEAVKLFVMVQALANYKINANEKTRELAQDNLHPQSVASRAHGDHLGSLFYLYNLRARFPELAHPSDSELPFAERARQGADACQQVMAQGGLHLDGSPDSFKKLDQHMRDIYRHEPEETKQKMMVFLWGCYFGEVVRRELAGGQWQFQGDLMDTSLVWDMGEVRLDLWAFEYVSGCLQEQTEQTLYQLWLDTEKAYIDYGLAARYAD
jgi:hypothetical protein